MAIVIPSSVMDDLSVLGKQLLDAALVAAPGYCLVDEGSTPQERLEVEHVTALHMSMQAVLRTSQFSELGLMIALGTVCGTIMAQCVSDRRSLYQAFQAQFGETMREVAKAAEPAGMQQ